MGALGACALCDGGAPAREPGPDRAGPRPPAVPGLEPSWARVARVEAPPVPGDAALGGPAEARGDLATTARCDQFRGQDDAALVLQALGLRGPAEIARLPGITGGQNWGVWTLRCPAGHVVLKLVSAAPSAYGLPSEPENIVRCAQRWPAVRADPALTFPIKLINCATAQGIHSTILVMKCARGSRLAEWMGVRARSEAGLREISSAMEQFGRFVQLFHHRYQGQIQHTDLQPSNIFIAEESGSASFVLVDCGWLGTSAWESDKDHFVQSLRLLGRTYGANFFGQARAAFLRGFGAYTDALKISTF
jgi:hypothetical protein